MVDENRLSVWEKIYRKSGAIFQEPLEEVIRFAPLLKSMGCHKVLDLGCGNGRHLIYLAGQGFQLYGADSSPTGLALAQSGLKMAGLEANLLLADFRQPMAFREAAFDALLSTRVIHHARLAAIQEAAAEVGRIVHPGGLILIVIPIGWNKNEAWEEIEPRTYVPLGGKEMGLPHHIFRLDEIPELFSTFETLEMFAVEERLGVFIGERRA